MYPHHSLLELIDSVSLHMGTWPLRGAGFVGVCAVLWLMNVFTICVAVELDCSLVGLGGRSLGLVHGVKMVSQSTTEFHSVEFVHPTLPVSFG